MGSPSCRALLATLLLSGCSPAAPVPAVSPTPAAPPVTVEVPAPGAAATPAQPDAEDDAAPEVDAVAGSEETPRVSPPAAENPEAVRQRILAGIRRIGAGRFEVSEEARDLMFENLGRAAGQVRVQPADRAGQVIGVKLLGIRPGDPFAALGFENGDILREVAGRSVTRPDEALEAYVAMQRTKSVVVEVERQGKPLTLTYEITPK